MPDRNEQKRIDDVLLNWRGQMVPDMRGMTERVAQAMDRKLAEGVSIDAAVEILVGCGMPLDTVKLVAEERRRQVLAAAAALHPKPTPPPAEPPTRYADVANKVAAIVDDMPTDEVIVVLAGRSKSTPALVRLTDRQRAEFRSVVAMAKQTGDGHMVEAIHKWVAPHVETAIADSEILARRLAAEGYHRSYPDEDGSVLVREDKTNNAYTVDPVGMTCTCSRYVYGGFAHAGLACEHILLARASEGPRSQEANG